MTALSFNQDPGEKAQAKTLLNAVVKNDLRMVDSLLSGGVNPNCAFDGVPLLAIAAARNLPLGLIRLLTAHGADPTQSVGVSGSKMIGYVPSAIAKDPEVKDFLTQEYTKALQNRDMSVEQKPLHHFQIGQYKKDRQRFLLEEPRAYWKKNYTSFSSGGDNGIIVEAYLDTILPFLENEQAIISGDRQAETREKLQRVETRRRWLKENSGHVAFPAMAIPGTKIDKIQPQND